MLSSHSRRSGRWPAFVVTAAAAFCTAQNIAAPPDAPGGPPVHKEHREDPPLPTPQQPEGILPRGPSNNGVQVNVNAAGANIVGDAANEPSIAIDPTNPQHIVIGWRQFNNVASNFRQAGWAYSQNGGQTWTFPGVLENNVFRSDPVLGCDGLGRFFYNSLKQNFCIDVWRSENGGVTWPTLVPAFGGDKQWMDIDRRTSGQGAGNIYFAWQPGAQCQSTGNLFTRSTDAGVSWMTPVALPQNPSFGTVAVGPDGEVYVAGSRGASFNSAVFAVARSLDARNPLATPTFTTVTGSFFAGGALRGGVFPNPGGLMGQVWIAVNFAPGANRGHVYMLCAVDPPGADTADVYFTRSSDGGATWATAVRVNDDAPTSGAFQWFGTMSVAPNGRIDAIWNDTRDDPNNALSRLYYAFSLDEGATWSVNQAISDAWNSLEGFPNQNKIGDYYHSISDNTGVSVAYAATFNFNPTNPAGPQHEQDVYFIRIPAIVDCNHNGTTDALDIESGQSRDCDSNGIPDECQPDCNRNGTADACDIRTGASLDCNHNSTPDECEPGHSDCNQNGTPDLCETVVDCNTNGTLDPCDIAAGAGDCNSNGVPDVCELPPAARAADACADARLITSGVLYTATTSLSTTTDPGSGTMCNPDAPSGRDVYYKYRPVTDGLLTINMCTGSSFDTVMSVHTGCPATAANQLPGACNDDACGGGGASIISNLAVTRATTYLIRVAGFNNAGSGGDTGTFGLRLTGPVGAGDCNTNGVPDECEAAAGGDADHIGVLDICEPFPPCTAFCRGDMNADARLDGDDVQRFTDCILSFPPAGATCGCADMNDNHQLNAADVTLFVARILSGACP